jgi:hypothetical protein
VTRNGGDDSTTSGSRPQTPTRRLDRCARRRRACLGSAERGRYISIRSPGATGALSSTRSPNIPTGCTDRSICGNSRRIPDCLIACSTVASRLTCRASTICLAAVANATSTDISSTLPRARAINGDRPFPETVYKCIDDVTENRAQCKGDHPIREVKFDIERDTAAA